MSKKTSVYAKYTFTEEEKRDIALSLAQKCQEKSQLEDEKKAVASSIKSRIDTVDSSINTLSGHLRQGYEYRNIECELFLNKDRKVRQYIDADGGVVKEEPFTAEDFQETLNLE